MNKPPSAPATPNQLAKMIVDLSTGNISDESKNDSEENKNVVRARNAGRVGGAARALSVSKLRRSEIAKEASLARWKKDRTDA